MICTYEIKNTDNQMLTLDYLMKESEKRKEICFLGVFSKEEITKICKHYLAIKELANLMGYEWENHTTLTVENNDLSINLNKTDRNGWSLRYMKERNEPSVRVRAVVLDPQRFSSCACYPKELFEGRSNELNLDLSWAYRSFIEAIELKRTK